MTKSKITHLNVNEPAAHKVTCMVIKLAKNHCYLTGTFRKYPANRCLVFFRIYEGNLNNISAADKFLT